MTRSRPTPKRSPLALVCLAAVSTALLGVDCSGLKQRMYEGDDRDAWQQPERVVAALGIGPGDRIADVGSGSGYFTLRLAEAVAPDGHVLAVDVDADMNARLERRLADAGVGNVSVVLATAEDPGLPAGSVDLIFTSNTFHHLPDQAQYFRQVMPALAPGGRVAIVEYDPSRSGWFTRTFGHSTGAQEIAAAMEAAGYRPLSSHDFLEQQSFQIFAPAR